MPRLMPCNCGGMARCDSPPTGTPQPAPSAQVHGIPPASSPLGQWQHAAVTYDGSRVRFYLNGVLDANQPQVQLRFGVADEPLVIGADFPGGDEFFAGTIRSARVYGRALTASELISVENFPPALAPIADAQMCAGQTLAVTNTATDPNVPPQSLTYRIVSSPPGAQLNSASGLFTFTPALSQAPSTNGISLAVSDNGLPSLSSTQSFSVTVRLPATPALGQLSLSGSFFSFDVHGDPGLPYRLLGSTNLRNWALLLVTNPPATPFRLAIPFSNCPQSFYRIQLQ